MPHIIRANIIRRGNKVHCIFHKTIFTTEEVSVKGNFVIPWLQNLATISGLLRDVIGSFEFSPYCDWPLKAWLITIATR